MDIDLEEQNTSEKQVPYLQKKISKKKQSPIIFLAPIILGEKPNIQPVFRIQIRPNPYYFGLPDPDPGLKICQFLLKMNNDWSNSSLSHIQNCNNILT